MGMLANAMGFGTAPQAAQSSLGWGAVGTGLDAVGGIMGGVGGFQQAQYQAAIADRNAAIMQQNVGATLRAGQYAEETSKLHTGQMVGAERAAQGANGVDVNIGSTVAVRDSTARLGAMDAAMIHYNAAREAYGQGLEAQTLRTQAAVDRTAAGGELAGGFFKAGTSLLGGATSLGSKYAQYQLSGAT